MAIQPTTRLAGSEHILRFQGLLLPAGEVRGNAEVAGPVVANTPVEVLFALADLTALSDATKRLPPGVFDNDVPAGNVARPNNTVAGGPAGNFGALPVSSLNLPGGKTWMQNIRVRAHEASASTATPLVAQVYDLLPKGYVDTATTGLSLNTGAPVVGVLFSFTAAGVTALDPEEGAGVPVVVEIEIPYTVQR